MIQFTRDVIINVVANLIAGFLGALFAVRFGDSVLLQTVSYQEGWYALHGHYLSLSVVTLVLYAALLHYWHQAYWTYVLLLPTAAVYLYAHDFIPLNQSSSVIEFVAFWCLLAQLTAVALVVAYRVWTNIFRT